MNWIALDRADQLAEIEQKSFSKPQVIYKHSISCPTSSMMKHRLEKSTEPANVDFYYLDLLNYRDISNKVAADYSIKHESPQILLIKDGKCSFMRSHYAINMDEIVAEVM